MKKLMNYMFKDSSDDPIELKKFVVQVVTDVKKSKELKVLIICFIKVYIFMRLVRI